MLVLSRKPGERIAIGEAITITVLEVGRGRIRLGIDAPPECSISRPKPGQKASLTGRAGAAHGAR